MNKTEDTLKPVWGEIWFSRKAEEAGDKLQQIADEKIDDANTNVAKAHEMAAILEKEAAGASASASVDCGWSFKEIPHAKS